MDHILTRYVTVPYQFVELELFKSVHFIWTGVENQFISFELRLKTSSSHLSWDWKSVHFIWTEIENQFISFKLNCSKSSVNLEPLTSYWKLVQSRCNWPVQKYELNCSTSSFHLNWDCKPVHFIWTEIENQFISVELRLSTSSGYVN
jgi:hypothetical protein